MRLTQHWQWQHGSPPVCVVLDAALDAGGAVGDSSVGRHKGQAAATWHLSGRPALYLVQGGEGKPSQCLASGCDISPAGKLEALLQPGSHLWQVAILHAAAFVVRKKQQRVLAVQQ